MLLKKKNLLTLLTFTLLFSLFLSESTPKIYKSKINPNFEEDENGIFLINDSNFDSFIKSFPFSMIFSFKDPCKLCRQILPEINKTINPLKSLNTPVYMAKLNSTEAPQSAMKLQLKNMFQLNYYSEGNPSLYDGGRYGEDIVQWIREKFDPIIGDIKSIDEIELLRKYSDALVVFFGEEKNEKSEEKFNQFFLNSRPKERIMFVKCLLPSCREKYQMDIGDIKIFRKDDKRLYEIKSQEYNAKDLRKKMQKILRGRVMKMDREIFDLIFTKGKNALFIYSPKSEQKKYVELLDQLYDFAKENKLKLVNCDLAQKFELKIKQITGFKNSELPLAVIHDFQTNKMRSYVMEKNKPFTMENLKAFIVDYKNSRVPLNIKSMEVPLKQKKIMYEIVGKTLEDYVLNKEKDFVVLFYTPWCQRSKTVWKTMEKVAEKMKEKDDIKFGTFNIYSNDQYLLDLKEFPKVVMWPAHSKDKPIITEEEFDDGNRFLNFLNENAYNKFNVEDYKFPEETKEDKDKEDQMNNGEYTGKKDL